VGVDVEVEVDMIASSVHFLLQDIKTTLLPKKVCYDWTQSPLIVRIPANPGRSKRTGMNTRRTILRFQQVKALRA
jgi:hypothetical protein